MNGIQAKVRFCLGMPLLAIRNLFFLACAVGDLTKVRIAKSARGGPFSYSTLDVMRLCSRTFLQENGLEH